jgi:hypothetical protein
MFRKNSQKSMRHISDEELLRSADGELSSRRHTEVGVHLETCWDCRARMEQIQSTIADFVRAHHSEFDAQLPPVAGPRALLRARLRELASEPQAGRWKRVFQLGFGLPSLAAICLASILMTTGILWFRHASKRPPNSASLLFDAEAAPNRNLTPGATRQVTISEVCSAPQEEVVGDVSISLRQKVLQEYGIASARPEDYEIDYLIAPRLGGTEDIRNLWPEPYQAKVWNAFVKDALEQRLHELVCDGRLDLQTAQREIATDWIAAYKKYFHTDKPLRS